MISAVFFISKKMFFEFVKVTKKTTNCGLIYKSTLHTTFF